MAKTKLGRNSYILVERGTHCTRDNYTEISGLMGLEVEIPVCYNSCPLHTRALQERQQQAYDNSMLFFKKELPEFLPMHDGGGVELRTPIDNIGQQRRWVKTILRKYEKLCQEVPQRADWATDWSHNAGIHVHYQFGSKNGVYSQKLRDLLTINSRIWDIFNKVISHRGNSYRENTHVCLTMLRSKPKYRLEFRLFNSHPQLMLPALEFVHSMVEFTKYFVKSGKPSTQFTPASYIEFIRDHKHKDKWANIYAVCVAYTSYENDDPRSRLYWPHPQDVTASELVRSGVVA